MVYCVNFSECLVMRLTNLYLTGDGGSREILLRVGPVADERLVRCVYGGGTLRE